jgi:outer membrane protein TolC
MPGHDIKAIASNASEESQERILTLPQVIDLALLANRTILEAQYTVQGQTYSIVSAESEFDWKYIPSTSAAASKYTNRLGAGVTLKKKSSLGPTLKLSPAMVQSDTNSENNLSGQIDLALTVPLLRGWGRAVNMDTVSSAHYSSRAAQRSYHLAKVNVAMDTITALYDIIEQEKLVKLNRQQAERLTSHAVLAKAKEKIGLATPMDVYRAQIRLKDAQDQRNRSQEALGNAKDRLKIILAAPLEDPLQVTASLAYVPLKISIEQALTTAYENRVELDEAVDKIENLQRNADVARHNIKPQLDLVGRYNHLGVEDPFATGLDTEDDYWSVSLVSTSDWRRTSEKATYQRALLSVKAAKLNRWALNDSISRQVRQRFDTILKAQERMQIRKEQIQQAKEKLALAQVKFNHGMADNYDVIEAQSELQSAQISLLAAKIEHIIGRYQLRVAMGTLIESNYDNTLNQIKR